MVYPQPMRKVTLGWMATIKRTTHALHRIAPDFIRRTTISRTSMTSYSYGPIWRVDCIVFETLPPELSDITPTRGTNVEPERALCDAQL
jgi:hypothetical protein